MAQDGQDWFWYVYVCQQSKDGRVVNECVFLKEVWEEWRHDNPSIALVMIVYNSKAVY